MNIGFMVPQNGGVTAQHVAIIDKNNTRETDDAPKDVGQLISSVIEDLNHLKMDIDQGCQGDAQIDELQKCCDNLSHAIEQLGNAPQQHQNGAFTGAISNDSNGNGSEDNGFDASTI